MNMLQTRRRQLRHDNTGFSRKKWLPRMPDELIIMLLFSSMPSRTLDPILDPMKRVRDGKIRFRCTLLATLRPR